MTQPSPSRPRAQANVRFAGRLRGLTPGLVWLACIAAILLLAQGRHSRAGLRGLVESRQHTVVAPIEGRLETVLVTLHQEVQPGQRLARFADADLRLRLTREQHELERLAAELREREADLERQAATDAMRQAMDQSTEQRRLASALEAAQLDALGTRAELAEARVREQGLAIETGRLTDLAQKGLLADTELVRRRTEHDALKQRIAELEQVQQERHARIAASQARLERFAFEQPGAMPRDVALAPQRWRIRVQETRLDELTLQASQLDLLAPAAGRIASLAAQSGDWLRPGALLLTVVDPTPQRIVAYLPDTLRTGLRLDQPLQVVRADGRPAGHSPVQSISPALVAVPERLWRIPGQPEWAWEVILPPLATLAPGEAIGLQLR